MLLEPPWQGKGVICSMLKLGDSPEMLPTATGRAGEQKLQLTACWGVLENSNITSDFVEKR